MLSGNQHTRTNEGSSLTKQKDQMNDSYFAFLDRLKKAHKSSPSQDILSILNFFLKLPRKFKKIFLLKSGETRRLSKRETRLGRTVNLVRTESDEFMLIISKNNKLENDSEAQGTQKKGKTVERLDSNDKEYFKLSIAYQNNWELDNLEEEVRLSKQLGATLLKKSMLGASHIGKQGEKKIDIFVPKALFDLQKLLDTIFGRFPINNLLSLYQKSLDQMILDLLLHVRKIHDAGFVHQDIKFKNILIYYNGERLSMELCDFGLTREMDEENCLPQATIGFQSPEISLLYFQSEKWNQAEYCYFYLDGMTCNTLGYQYFDQQNLKFDDYKIEREKYKTVHKANDIWALGIVIFALKNSGKMPRSIQDLYSIHDPLIKGLLDPKRETRLTIHQAIEIHQMTMTIENPLAVLFRTAKNFTPQDQTLQQNLKAKRTEDTEKTSKPSIRKTTI